MKILNLYAGLGGNRKLWNNVNVTAVEKNPLIADEYAKKFPNDKLVIGDAHAYLIENLSNYDFIWSSPPCPSHSSIRKCGVHRGLFSPVYPDIDLYQEILLLKYYAPKNTKWVVENVIPYYQPLIPCTKKIGRHLFWSNFPIGEFRIDSDRKHNNIKSSSTIYGFSVQSSEIENKVKVLRNLVNPNLGLHILNSAKKIPFKDNKQFTLNFKL